MSAPDRIWAWASAYKPQGVSLSGGSPPAAMEYIRRDHAVLAALPEVQALIAGAFEAAAQHCEQWRVDAMMFDLKSDATCFETARDEIRTMTPADAIAASDVMIAAEREACAKVIETRAEEYDHEHGAYDPSTGVTEYPGNGDEWMEEWENCAAAIRKRGEG